MLFWFLLIQDVLQSSPRLHCCFSSEGQGIALVPVRAWLTFQQLIAGSNVHKKRIKTCLIVQFAIFSFSKKREALPQNRPFYLDCLREKKYGAPLIFQSIFPYCQQVSERNCLGNCTVSVPGALGINPGHLIQFYIQGN